MLESRSGRGAASSRGVPAGAGASGASRSTQIAAAAASARAGAARRRLAVAAVLAAALAWGCDRHVEPFDPSAEPRQPDLSRIFPEPSRQREAAPSPGMPPAPEAAAAAAASPVTGRVVLPAEAEPPPGAALFLIARAEGAAAGPPLAVRRIADPRFPLEFEIGPQHVMMPGVRFEGPMRLTARLDSDGNASTRLPGDRQGRAERPVTPGSGGVEIVLGETL